MSLDFCGHGMRLDRCPRCEELRQQHWRHEGEISALSAENQRLREALERVEARGGAEIERLRAEIERLTRERDGLRAELAEVKQTLEMTRSERDGARHQGSLLYKAIVALAQAYNALDKKDTP